MCIIFPDPKEWSPLSNVIHCNQLLILSTLLHTKCQSTFLGLNCIQSDLTSCVPLCKDATTTDVVTVEVEVAMIGWASVETVQVTRISRSSFLKVKE